MTCPPTREQRLAAERDRFREALETIARLGAPHYYEGVYTPQEVAKQALEGSGRAEGGE